MKPKTFIVLELCRLTRTFCTHTTPFDEEEFGCSLQGTDACTLCSLKTLSLSMKAGLSGTLTYNEFDNYVEKQFCSVCRGSNSGRLCSSCPIPEFLAALQEGILGGSV